MKLLLKVFCASLVGSIILASGTATRTVAHSYPAGAGQTWTIGSGAQGTAVKNSSHSNPNGSVSWSCDPSQAVCAEVKDGGSTLDVHDGINDGGDDAPGSDVFAGYAEAN